MEELEAKHIEIEPPTPEQTNSALPPREAHLMPIVQHLNATCKDVWQIEVLADGVKFTRLINGKVNETYRTQEPERAAVYAVAISQGFLPPRDFRYPDRPAGQIPSGHAYLRAASVDKTSDQKNQSCSDLDTAPVAPEVPQP